MVPRLIKKAAEGNTPYDKFFKDLVDRAPETGFSYNPVTNTSPTQRYIVSEPEGEVVVPADRLTPEEVEHHVDLIKNILANPNAFQGGWLNHDDGNVYLDVSRQYPDLNQALEAGKRNNQYAIFDRQTGQSIPVPDSDRNAKSAKVDFDKATTEDGEIDWNKIEEQKGETKEAAVNHPDYNEETGRMDPEIDDNEYQTHIWPMAYDNWIQEHPDAAQQQFLNDDQQNEVDQWASVLRDGYNDGSYQVSWTRPHEWTKRGSASLPKFVRTAALPSWDNPYATPAHPGLATVKDRWMQQSNSGPRPQRRTDQQGIEESNYYMNQPEALDRPEMQDSYKALSDALVGQYNDLRGQGFRYTPYDKEGEPYANSDEMRADLAKGHMYYRPTDVNGDLQENHPMRQTVDTVDGPMMLNDVFRSVHDQLGHGFGASFGPLGEQQAWMNHRETLPAAAHPALYTETRGQNVYTNYGTSPEFGEHSKLPVAQRPFGPQRVVWAPQYS